MYVLVSTEKVDNCLEVRSRLSTPFHLANFDSKLLPPTTVEEQKEPVEREIRVDDGRHASRENLYFRS